MSGSSAMKSTANSFELSDAVTLFTEQSSSINNLWALFVVATFSAAGFGLSEDLSAAEKWAISAGFLVFALGHASLVVMAVRLQHAVGRDISEAIKHESSAFNHSIKTMIAHMSSMTVSMLSHIIIDGCVMIAIWARLGDVGGHILHFKW